MATRRGRYYPLRDYTGEVWCVATNTTSRVIGWVHYSASEHHEALFSEIATAVADAGWIVEPHHAWMGSFFSRSPTGLQRIHIHLQRIPPANPLPEWELPGESRTIVDCLP